MRRARGCAIYQSQLKKCCETWPTKLPLNRRGAAGVQTGRCLAPLGPVRRILPSRGARSHVVRFLLKVDGQFKCSFGSEEAAKTAGAAIKKAYPVVAVTVVDSQEHKTEAINV